jgi:two-component system, sensor histidine kinase
VGKLQSKTVVVVDDEPALALTFKLLVQREGHAAFSAESYQDAVNTLSECDAVDLLLTDFALDSKYTGFDVIDVARSRFPELPCVMISGYATRDVVERASAIGVPVMHKPVPIEHLLEIIRNFLEVNATLERKAS